MRVLGHCGMTGFLTEAYSPRGETLPKKSKKRGLPYRTRVITEVK